MHLGSHLPPGLQISGRSAAGVGAAELAGAGQSVAAGMGGGEGDEEKAAEAGAHPVGEGDEVGGVVFRPGMPMLSKGCFLF